jgi:hypothetical protein
MKSLLALLGIALLGACVSACGSSRTGAASTSRTSPSGAASSTSTSGSVPTPTTKIDGDKDNDIGAPHDDTNNNGNLDFGHAASADEKRMVTALVKRYYATAVAEDGKKACSMIYSTLAESVPEDYGQFDGPPYMRGAKTCQAALTGLFKHWHSLLTLEVPKLEVTHVRLIEHHGFALLSFGAPLPEREIPVGREGRAWKIERLLDSELA